MGKKKLPRFRELGTLDRVFQPTFEEVSQDDFHLKGKWCREVFQNDRPLVLELGCGKGEYTVGLAATQPEKNYMGLDIKGARLWTGAKTAHEDGLENVAFLRTQIDFINSFFSTGEVDEIWVTFPDPQSKKRRHKKRLTGVVFLNKYRLFLKNNGMVHLKTANDLLYQDTLALAKFNNLEIVRCTDDIYQEGWDDETVSIQTYYEKSFLAKGERINYISFKLPKDLEIKKIPDEVQ